MRRKSHMCGFGAIPNGFDDWPVLATKIKTTTKYLASSSLGMFNQMITNIPHPAASNEFNSGMPWSSRPQGLGGSCQTDAIIRVYDVIETREHSGDFRVI